MCFSLRSLCCPLGTSNHSESQLADTGTAPDESEHRTITSRQKPKQANGLKNLFKKKSDSAVQPLTAKPTDNAHPPPAEKHAVPEGTNNEPLPQPPSVVPADNVPTHVSNQDGLPSQHNFESVDAERKAAAGAVKNMHTPEGLTSFLRTLSKFNSIVDTIAAIHPYSQAAWFIFSQVSNAITGQGALDESIQSLLEKMDEVYTFLVQKELRDIEFMKSVVERICQQTLECSYFIREYSNNTKFRMRLLKNLVSDKNEQVLQYNNVFDQLMQEFRDKAVRDTVVVVHRIWENLGDLAQDVDLNSMPYVGGAGLNTQKLCLEGTRNEVLDELTGWINNFEDDSSRVFWLNGNAGSGKSSIAHTIADRFKKLGRLGSCYCFDRNELIQQRDKKIFTTIARDLADRDEQMRKKLVGAIHSNTSLKNTIDISQQWKELIIKPAMTLSESMVGPIVVIIDALDESGDRKSREQLLRILAGKPGDDEANIMKLPPHFRFLVTSRPLPDIAKMLNNVEHVHSKSMDSIPFSTTERDIHHYISCQLSSLDGVEVQEVSAELAAASDGLFEWARLACAFIRNDYAGLTVRELLDAILTRNKDARVPLLDGMYKLTLETVFPEGSHQRSVSLGRFRSVMAQILKTVEPLPLVSLATMRRHFANKEPWEIDAIVKHLGALLGGTTDPSAVVRPLHASFPEFLEDPKRSGEFFVNHSDVDKELAFACLGVMEDELRFNMCKLPSSFLPNSEVPDLAERIKENISPALSYSCQYWAAHLRLTHFDFALAGIIRTFLNHERLLFWLEVMSLLKKIGICISLLSDVIYWVRTHIDCKDIANTAADVQRFIRVFGGPISFSTPHLYVSAIPFSPKSSHISKKFASRLGKVLRIARGHNETWPVIQGLLYGHQDEVTSVSFSPDGKHIVSGSHDETIRLWDAETGELVRPPLEGHGDWVKSVAFSPDGKCIVSGSRDKTIRLWDAETGELVQPPLVGHEDSVESVSFSLNGKQVVSGSQDRTIRLWDAETGELVRLLEGHEDPVLSVSISPDCKYIVSGSLDKTVRLWDAETGGLVRLPLEGHEDWVLSVAFSPDGKYIVSGSVDKMIRLWDTETGGLVQPPLKGHGSYVWSVAFSPDGKWIVSGSEDNTIRLWDTETGELVRPPLEGHEGWVKSAAFSPDGKRIVSGSREKTIRLWDAETEGLVRPQLMGHKDSVQSVAFAPDGKRIVSGSQDRTIQLWDAETGILALSPFVGHERSVQSVAFSPDGKCIVSGSGDKTIRLWDAETGKLVRPPLEGHGDSIKSVAFSPDGKCIVSGSEDHTIRLWDAETGELIRLLEGHEDPVLSVTFSPDGKHIVSGSEDETIRLWDAETGGLVRPPLEGHKSWVQSVAFSPDGKHVVSGSDDDTVQLWDAETGGLIQPLLEGHKGRVLSVAFSPDGKCIVSGSSDRTIRLWDAETGQPIQPSLEGHERQVQSVAFSLDGKSIVSGSGDKTVRLWDAGIGELVQQSSEGQYMVKFSRQPEHSFTVLIEAGDPAGPPSLYRYRHLDNTTGQGWFHVGPMSNLLFWAPPALHLRQYYPGLLMIFPEPVQLDLREMAHGHLWYLCYSEKDSI